MSQHLPLISVYMPTHNRKQMAVTAIDSVLAQDYPHFELIVVDDGSTDDSWSFLQQRYGQNPKIRLLRHEQSQGACAARNTAIAAAQGDFVTGLDDDDVFYPDRLSSLMAAFQPGDSMVCSGYLWHYGMTTKRRFDSDAIIALDELLDLHTLSNQALVPTESMRALGGFDTSLAAFQDYDMWVRVVARFGPARRIGHISYQVNAGHEAGRITGSPKRLQAHDDFVAKHRALMSGRNLQNQAFYRYSMQQLPMTFSQLWRSRRYGLTRLKLRYYLKQKFSWLSQLRLKLMQKGWRGFFG
ncbi:glycosyltransferase [Alkalimonas mucilaginosa]|uniref:Glycosyltransferase n=1 Tax=Alkalimonas mucilaginosa TaxID=3057676 RepID=A0ABU7JHP2_9GAMM|nr:glycosyltransferase [Alkalimonas sp. MEB004]MEE2025170.1 glycosyltransferase [Alkalimonas sp. MEB004]